MYSNQFLFASASNIFSTVIETPAEIERFQEFSQSKFEAVSDIKTFQASDHKSKLAINKSYSAARIL